MTRLVGWLILAAALVPNTPCWAQSHNRPAPLPAAQTAPPTNQAQVTAPARQPPNFTVLGVHAGIDAPVSPSYAGTAYHTLAGQPETGADAIAGQVMQPDDASPR